MPKILKPSDVAELLQISISTVYKYAEKGEIKSFKIGSNLRFREEYIIDYVQKLETEVR